MRTNFGAQIQAFKKRTLAKSSKLVVLMGVEAYVQVYTLSIVDTGRFRASWRAANSHADKSVAPAAAGGGITSEKSAIGRKTRPNPALITKVRNILKARKMGEAAVISNNVDYALKIEHGGYEQAPSPVLPIVEAQLAAQYPDFVRKL